MSAERPSDFSYSLLSFPAFSQHHVLRAHKPLLIVHGLFAWGCVMRYETITLGSNVIRLPIELRAKPSIDLLIEVASDSREVELIAEAFGFDAPDPEERRNADRAMAETIAKIDLPVDPKERRAPLNAMLRPLVDRAVAACAEARQAALRSDEAGAELVSAQMEGGYWFKPLEEAVNHRAVGSARLLLVAHAAAEAAHGAGRAIAFAKRNEPWRPTNVDEDVDVLVAAQQTLAR